MTLYRSVEESGEVGASKCSTGHCLERDGVGFAGTKGFVGGFGRGMLTAFGEREVKQFVQASIDEALKLERAMSRLRHAKARRRAALFALAETVQGEAPEIFPFLGTSRLAEVVDRRAARNDGGWSAPNKFDDQMRLHLHRERHIGQRRDANNSAVILE